jgi:hypothetical protein
MKGLELVRTLLVVNHDLPCLPLADAALAVASAIDEETALCALVDLAAHAAALSRDRGLQAATMNAMASAAEIILVAYCARQRQEDEMCIARADCGRTMGNA